MSTGAEQSTDGKLSLVIITGLSGAGKSLVLNKLEDNGYFCADNMPFSLLSAFVEQCKAAKPMLSLAAVVIDSREAVFGTDWEQMLTMLDNLDVRLRIVFLECRNDILLRRYNETRRRHPLAGGDDILAGVMRERALLQRLKERAHIVIDTSDTTPLTLTEKLGESLSLPLSPDILVIFTSFGYKRGVPVEADIVLDMRFLPNPFYEAALRPLSGADAPVREYLFRERETAPFFDTVEQALRLMLPGFCRQGKRHIVVAFGCTGGRHRSVLAATEMHRRFTGGQYGVILRHRDFSVEADDIALRFTREGTPL